MPDPKDLPRRGPAAHPRMRASGGAAHALTLACAAAVYACVSPAVAQSRSEPPPNVIIMLADDMGMGDTSAYQDITGNPDAAQVHTPAMEKLARLGVRMSDGHSTSTRCSPTRYGLMTGRYPWRNRIKQWVLARPQGDPMIEADRPTIASMLADEGYSTALIGKWHVGLRYRRADGGPAAGWTDADLTQPLHTTPLDHGFDVARYLSRSHLSAGPRLSTATNMYGRPEDRNAADQPTGPGHIHGRRIMAASGDGKRLVEDGPHAYVMEALGARFSDGAMDFLQAHTEDADQRRRPFFLYYASPANHTPYTPSETIGGKPVKGRGLSVAGAPMGDRADYIFENDVILGRFIDWLAITDDPRRPGRPLLENTLIVFASDNGAEINEKAATGPFRSNKGSVFEGGHRTPFLVSWPLGNVGDGNDETPGATRDELVASHDLFATLAGISGAPMPDLRAGEKGGEDSTDILPVLRGETPHPYPPLFHNDHKEHDDPVVAAVRVNNPIVDGEPIAGRWKLFFSPALLRAGQVEPEALYELGSDQMETRNRLDEPALAPLIAHISALAELHRNVGGHRLADLDPGKPVTFTFEPDGSLRPAPAGAPTAIVPTMIALAPNGMPVGGAKLSRSADGIGVRGSASRAVNGGEALEFTFSADVIVEHVAIVAGDGVCGGSYSVGNAAPLAIYCVDADNDPKDQSGVLGDIGVVRAGETLRLDSSAHYGAEAPGEWRVRTIRVRPLDKETS